MLGVNEGNEKLCLFLSDCEFAFVLDFGVCLSVNIVSFLIDFVFRVINWHENVLGNGIICVSGED